jgi:hypothetical protein
MRVPAGDQQAEVGLWLRQKAERGAWTDSTLMRNDYFLFNIRMMQKYNGFSTCFLIAPSVGRMVLGSAPALTGQIEPMRAKASGATPCQARSPGKFALQTIFQVKVKKHRFYHKNTD